MQTHCLLPDILDANQVIFRISCEFEFSDNPKSSKARARQWKLVEAISEAGVKSGSDDYGYSRCSAWFSAP
jgi:hypothetical protein